MRRIIFFTLTLVLLLPSSTFAFNPNYIVQDDALFDGSAMTLRDIQRFLDARAGTLKYYLAFDIDGALRTATEIIWRAAQQHRINPKYILTTLQKEQSLIDDPRPTQDQYDWAMGYGICDDCDKNDPGLQKFRGFAAQVNGATARNRYYVENPQEFTYQKEKTSFVDGTPITPLNQATANLYNYTPHIRGNTSFFKLFQRWFIKQYPDGTLLQVKKKPGVWLIENGTRRPFLSKSVLTSRFNPRYVIEVEESDLLLYSEGRPLKFSNYSLLKAPWGTIYLIVDNERRGIASREVFRRIGFNPEEVIPVAKEDLDLYTEGSPITIASAYPTGALLRDKASQSLYYVENGTRRFATDTIAKARYPGRRGILTTSANLASFSENAPLTMPNGSLIKTADDPAIYVVENGMKRRIGSMETFNALGYKTENILLIDTTTLAIHQEGEPIEFYQ